MLPCVLLYTVIDLFGGAQARLARCPNGRRLSDLGDRAGRGTRGRRRGQVYVALAALAWSSAGVLQRELSVNTATQVAGRALFAPLPCSRSSGSRTAGSTLEAFTSIGRAELAVAACTAVASASFIVALNHTTVANVLFMQAVAPIAAALIAWSALHESVSRRTGVAMVVALAGVALMVGGPGNAPGLGLGALAS